MADHAEIYEDPPLDEEEVEMSLVPTVPQVRIPINVDQAIQEFQDYQRLCREILDDNDYATIRGIKARKRSGWAKLRRFYNISTRVLEEVRVPPLAEWEPGQAFMYRFTVAGWLGQRLEHGDGACESEELAGSSIAPTEHNVRAKALTRAKNRVTADLIGGGEVSAEELNGTEVPKARKAQSKKRQAPTKEKDPELGQPGEVTVGLIQQEANAQLEAMGYEPHYKSRAHSIKAMEACGYKGTATKYLTDNFADIVACLIDRVKEKEESE